MGNHFLVSLYGVSFALLNDSGQMRAVFDRAADACGATVLHRFTHDFEPYGVSLLYALAESHLSAHSFPEKGSIAIDCYTCGGLNSRVAVDVLIEYFNPIEVSVKEVSR
jgi:S-adenosylmethionine decarboxylase